MFRVPDAAQLHVWGRKPRGKSIWLLHLPEDCPVEDRTGAGAPTAPVSELSDDVVRARWGLPENYLIVRHPEGTL
jgi:hypothetical protein